MRARNLITGVKIIQQGPMSNEAYTIKEGKLSEWTLVVRYFANPLNRSSNFNVSIRNQMQKKGLKSLSPSQRETMKTIYRQEKELCRKQTDHY